MRDGAGPRGTLCRTSGEGALPSGEDLRRYAEPACLENPGPPRCFGGTPVLTHARCHRVCVFSTAGAGKHNPGYPTAKGLPSFHFAEACWTPSCWTRPRARAPKCSRRASLLISSSGKRSGSMPAPRVAPGGQRAGISWEPTVEIRRLLARFRGRGNPGRSRDGRIGLQWYTKSHDRLSDEIHLYLLPFGYFGIVNVGDGAANLAMVLDTRRAEAGDPGYRMHSSP